MHSCSRKFYYHNTNVGYLFENIAKLIMSKLEFVPTHTKSEFCPNGTKRQ